MKYKHGKLLESIFVRKNSHNYFLLFPSYKTLEIYASILVNQYISYTKNHGNIKGPPFFKADGKYHVSWRNVDIRICAIINNLSLIEIVFEEVSGNSLYNGYIEYYYYEKKTHRDNQEI